MAGPAVTARGALPGWYLAATAVALAGALGYSALPAEPGPRAALFIGIQAALAAASLYALFGRKGAPLHPGFVLAAAVLVRAAAIPSDLIFENDVFRYLWDARVLEAGINPYAHPPAAEALRSLRDDWIWEQIPFREVSTIYPPLAQAAFALSRAVFGETVEGLQLLMLLFDLGTVLLLLRLGALLGAPRAAAAYALHPLAVKEFVQGAHIDALAVFCFTAALLLLLRRRHTATAALLAAAALVKVFPFVALPVLARRIGFARAGLAVALFLIPCAGVFAWGGQPFSGLGVFAQYWIFNPSAYDVLTRLLSAVVAPETAHTWARPLLGVTTLLLVALIARRVRPDDDRSLLRGALASVFVLLLCSPAANPWYVAWLLPLSLLLGWAPTLAWTYTASLSYAYWAGEQDVWPVRLLQYFVPLALLGVGIFRTYRSADRRAADAQFEGRKSS